MATTQTMARVVIKAFDADGTTVQQFSEPAGGQVVFHTHVHVIPRFEGVSLKPHTGAMADNDVLAAQAERYEPHWPEPGEHLQPFSKQQITPAWLQTGRAFFSMLNQLSNHQRLQARAPSSSQLDASCSPC